MGYDLYRLLQERDEALKRASDFPLIPSRQPYRNYTDKCIFVKPGEHLPVYDREGNLMFTAIEGHYRMPAEWAEIYEALGKCTIRGEYNE